MDKTKIYIDLSKCSEEQQKHVFTLLPPEPHRDAYNIFRSYKYLQFIPKSKFQEKEKWMVDKQALGKTELTYPEFIKLFEGGEEEVLQVENDYQDLKESHSELFRRLNQLRNRYKLDNLDKCLCRAKEINRKYANNEGFKIIQSDKNNVFFLDECIFKYCPTPNECKNGGCLSKSNNQ